MKDPKMKKNTLWEITHATRQMGTSGCGQEGKKKNWHNCFEIDYFDGNNKKKLII